MPHSSPPADATVDCGIKPKIQPHQCALWQEKVFDFAVCGRRWTDQHTLHGLLVSLRQVGPRVRCRVQGLGPRVSGLGPRA
eukprot:2118593-Rhodomonas_salina.1